jgi:hypothetical protein
MKDIHRHCWEAILASQAGILDRIHLLEPAVDIVEHSGRTFGLKHGKRRPQGLQRLFHASTLPAFGECHSLLKFMLKILDWMFLDHASHFLPSLNVRLPMVSTGRS